MSKACRTSLDLSSQVGPLCYGENVAPGDKCGSAPYKQRLSFPGSQAS